MAKNNVPPRPIAPPRPVGAAPPKPAARPRPAVAPRPPSPAEKGEPPPQFPERAAPKDLAMVPLSGRADGSYEDGKAKGSSTEYFAIPHAGRAARDAGPGAPPVGPPPVVGPMGAMGPVPVAPMVVSGIQGPVAGGPMMMGGPGMVGPGMAYGGPPPEERTQSYRVFAVMIALVGMVCVALVLTVGLVTYAVWAANQPEPPPPITAQPAPPSTTPEAVDTGLDLRKDKGTKVEVAKVKTPTQPRPPSPPKPAAPATAPEVNGASAAGEAGTISVRKPPEIYTTGIEVICGAFRERANFVNDVAVLNNVPAEKCEIRFKGGTVSAKLVSQGGRSFTCTAMGTSDLSCK